MFVPGRQVREDVGHGFAKQNAEIGLGLFLQLLQKGADNFLDQLVSGGNREWLCAPAEGFFAALQFDVASLLKRVKNLLGLASRLSECPPAILQDNTPRSSQEDLGVAKGVFPLLAKLLAVDDQFRIIATQVWKELRNLWVQFFGREGLSGKQVDHRVGKQPVCRPFPGLRAEKLALGLAKRLVEPGLDLTAGGLAYLLILILKVVRNADQGGKFHSSQHVANLHIGFEVTPYPLNKNRVFEADAILEIPVQAGGCEVG